jgi:hypothetical protein
MDEHVVIGVFDAHRTTDYRRIVSPKQASRARAQSPPLSMPNVLVLNKPRVEFVRARRERKQRGFCF